MTEIAHTFYVGKTQEGRWAAASNVSPYFFFEGDSERDVVNLTKEALEFFHTRSVDSVTQRQPRLESLSVSQFFKKKIEHFAFPSPGAFAVPAE